MSLNQTPVFVSWGEDKKDVILVCSPSGSPFVSSYVRDAFKEKHAPSVDTTDIHVYSKTDGDLRELDYFDELGDNGKSRDCPLHITVEAQPVEPAPLPPAMPRSKEVSNQIASVFEGEVNRYLDDHLQSVLPRCNFSKFKTREIDDDSTALEMDSFSYMWNDTCEPSQSNPSLGIYVVSPEHIIKKKPAGPGNKNNLKNSPGAQAANLATTVDKYIVGESYSGKKENSIKSKVTQLETKLQKMWHRHKALSGKNHADYTSLFGAAILAFTSVSAPRSEQYKKCNRAVLESLSCPSSPILWRLAQAERFFIVVLSTSDAANTCALREIASGQQSMEVGIYNIEQHLAKIAEHIGGR
jgi:hypothetical protein